MEATLCEDSPKHDFPPVPLRPDQVSWSTDKDPMLFAPYIEEARKHYHTIDYASEVCTAYRKEISDFYDFVKENGTPAGQPETTVAVIKGNYDLSGHRYQPGMPIGGAAQLADEDLRWHAGIPEYGWDCVKAAYYPLNNVLGEHRNLFLAGTPCGQVDIVSFAKDAVTARNLSQNYKALVFSGWNTCSDKQYGILKDFVERGGTLFAAIPHLSTDVTRNYRNYTAPDLVNGGNFSDLFGVKVRGKGIFAYWATAPRDNDEIASFPRRFGVLNSHLGDIEVVDPDADVLIVDDEQGEPFLIRRRLGRRTVYFLNCWDYPGAVNVDNGPGSTIHSPGLIGKIYRHIATRNRGTVWITDDGHRVSEGGDCEYLSYSYFPESNQVCLLNVDFDNPRSLVLHGGGQSQEITVGPGEFRLFEL